MAGKSILESTKNITRLDEGLRKRFRLFQKSPPETVKNILAEVAPSTLELPETLPHVESSTVVELKGVAAEIVPEVPPEVATEGPTSHILSFRKEVVASGSDNIEKRVPWDGFVDEVCVYLPTTNFLIDVRLVYYPSGNVDQTFVVPSVEGDYISGPGGPIHIRDVKFPVHIGGRLVLEIMNNDSSAARKAAVVVTLRKDPHV